jgi:hypothetical protein
MQETPPLLPVLRPSQSGAWGTNQEFLAALGGIQKWGVEVGAKNSRSDGVTLGYPIFSQNTLPIDEDLLERLFGDEVRAGVISSPLDITDAWKNSYSCSTNHKVWGAKFTARHPNLVALEISSFKCGHDAPIYGVVEGIIEQSGTPYFCFKDLDENKPSCSIRIRVETIDYFLRRYREEVIRKRKAEQDIEAQLAALEALKHLGWRSCAQVAMPAV